MFLQKIIKEKSKLDFLFELVTHSFWNLDQTLTQLLLFYFDKYFKMKSSSLIHILKEKVSLGADPSLMEVIHVFTEDQDQINQMLTKLELDVGTTLLNFDIKSMPL